MSSCFHRSASVISDGVFCHPALFIYLHRPLAHLGRFFSATNDLTNVLEQQVGS
jgi:hypothetical protein